MLAQHPQNKEVLDVIDRVHALALDQKTLEDAAVALWESAAQDGITEKEALMRYFGGETDADFPRLWGMSNEDAHDALLSDRPFVDEYFRDGPHGAYTHMFQEYALARVLGGPQEMIRIRHLIANALGPATGEGAFSARLFNAIFDSFEAVHVNSPEGLGPILKDKLNIF